MMSHIPCSRLRPLALIGLLVTGISPLSQASSHREAPYIAGHPKIDATDLYMFRSYESDRSDYVTLIANYQPMQDTYGGPNFFQLDPQALYDIRIDNNGDAIEDITYQFLFSQRILDLQVPVGAEQVSVPLINTGAITAEDDSALNAREHYTLTQVTGPLRSGSPKQAVTEVGSGRAIFYKPVDNIGTKSLPDYIAYAEQYMYEVTLPGCATPGRVFVGQRKESFAVNLGEIFDLVNVVAPATEFDADAEDKGLNDLENKNVTTLALEVPISCITNGSEPVIGAWTTASLRHQHNFIPSPGSRYGGSPSNVTGSWVRVSRLGMPLVNELVIGLKDKNRFNGSEPKEDAKFLTYVTNPTLPALLEILFESAGVQAPTNLPRNDLVSVFLTGVTGVNRPASVTPAEMLRLNTSIAAVPATDQNRLGVIEGDNAGFPNGRRPGDDVVDIALRVVMGKLCTLSIDCVPVDAPSGGTHFTDGALQEASQFDDAFPYLKAPLPGSSH